MFARALRIIVVFIGVSFAGTAPAQDFAAQGKPGPEHERLKTFLGKWELTVEGSTAKGSAEFKSILGGRFITEEAKLPFGGFTMEWLGIYGFDKNKKKYTAVWVDSMDTTTELGEGDADAAGKAFTFKGEHVDPRTSQPAKFIWRLAQDANGLLTIEMYDGDQVSKEKRLFLVKGVRSK